MRREHDGGAQGRLFSPPLPLPRWLAFTINVPHEGPKDSCEVYSPSAAAGRTFAVLLAGPQRTPFAARTWQFGSALARPNAPGSTPRRTTLAAAPPFPTPRWLADERASRRPNDSRGPRPWRRRLSMAHFGSR